MPQLLANKYLRYRKEPKFERNYVDSFIHYKNKHKVHQDDYINICKTFFHNLLDSMIDTGFFYKLPFHFGYIGLLKGKGSKSYVDLGHLTKTGEIKLHKNRHTDGYYARFAWMKERNQLSPKNFKYFKFFPSKSIKIHLSKRLREDPFLIDDYFGRYEIK